MEKDIKKLIRDMWGSKFQFRNVNILHNVHTSITQISFRLCTFCTNENYKTFNDLFQFLCDNNYKFEYYENHLDIYLNPEQLKTFINQIKN